MRPTLVAGAAAAVVAAAPAPASAACEIALDWKGARYGGIGEETARAGRELGKAVLQSCDEGDGPRESDRDVLVRALPGVAPGYAVTADGTLFVNPAYPLRLTQHPLHAAVYGHRRWPTCRPTRHLTVAGEFESLHDLLRLDPDAGPSALYVDDRTRMAPRFGRLEPGDRIRVAAAECRFAGGPSVPFARVVTVLERAPRDQGDEPRVLLAAAVTATLFALAFGVRALRGRSRAALER